MTIAMRHVVKFPANVQATKGVDVTRANGTYTFKLNYENLTPAATVASNVNIAFQDPATGAMGVTTLASALNSNANIQAIANTETGIDKLGYWNGTSVYALTDFPAYARGLISSDSASAARVALGTVIGTDVQAHSASLDGFAGKTVPTGNVVGSSDTQTLTNKTIDGDSNTLTNVPSSAVTGLSTVATSGAYGDLSGLPTLGDLAAKDQAAISDIAATGTPSSSTYLRGDGVWNIPAGGGDMIAATYDPDNVGSNAFDSSNQSFLQSGTGAVARAVRDKLCETISVKDFGAIGDGSTDDTTAFQACIDYAGTLGSYGVCVYFPAGTYKITSAVTLPQIALCIRGHSMHSTWVVQATAGANAFEFTAVTSNQAAGLWPAWKAFQFLDISIGRSANTGGYGLSLSWVAMTSAIAPLLLVDNVQITGYGTAGNNWARCINLFNASSVIIQNSWLYGNISESPSTSEQPYTTEACIYFDSDDTAGQLNNTIRNVQTSGSQYGIFVNNWHEGFYISDSKFLQHWYGIRIAGNATHQNPSFFLVNSEFDVRVTAIYAENVYDMKINQCSFLKAGYGSTAGAGFSGVLVNLSKCPLFTAIGNTHHTSDTSLPTGINLAADCHKSVISACIFHGNAFGVSAEGTAAVIADNVFSDCTTAISATGSNNTIGKNVYDSCTIRITNTDSTNEVAPFRHDAFKTAVFASSATSQTITFSLPAGRFVQAPRAAYITPAFDSGLYINAIYDQASSSATSAVVKIVEYQGAAIAAGSYVFCATFLDFN